MLHGRQKTPQFCIAQLLLFSPEEKHSQSGSRKPNEPLSYPRNHMLIRIEEKKDHTAVKAANVSAFETPAEANLVDALREQAHSFISLVAEENGEVIGHIMFSPVSLSGHPNLRVMGLGPLAVIPERQRKGVGAALVQAGLERCKGQGIDAVVVLGHPLYYPSFGFLPSTRFGIGCEYDVPAEVFMALELQLDALSGKTGIIKYHPAFSNV